MPRGARCLLLVVLISSCARPQVASPAAGPIMYAPNRRGGLAITAAPNTLVGIDCDDYRVAVTTNARGEATASGLPAGDCLVAKTKVEVAGDETRRAAVDVEPEPDDVTFGGVVRDAEGKPIANADVWISVLRRRVVVARSNASGDWQARVPRGRLHVTLVAVGFGRVDGSVDVYEDLRVDGVMRPGFVVEGHVVHSNGKPASDVRVTARFVEDWRAPVSQTFTDRTGHFRMTGLRVEPIVVEAMNESEIGRTPVLDVGPAAHAVRIALEPGVFVTGHTSAQRVRVGHAFGRPGADGRYIVGPALPGMISVIACDGDHCSRRAHRFRDRTATWDLDLPSAPTTGTVHVRVRDERGAPVAHADVLGSDFSSCATDRRGECTIARVAAHLTSFSASHPTAGAVEWVPFSVTGGETFQTIRLTPYEIRTGAVKWDDGTPAAGVDVSDLGTATRTDANGNYRLPVRQGLSLPRVAPALVLGESEAADRRDSYLHEQDVATIARPTEALAGTVLHPDGTPAAFARVRRGVGGSPRSTSGAPSTYADANGHFVFDRLVHGRFSLLADAPGFAPVEADKVETGTKNIELRLAPTVALDGTVTDEGGALVQSFAFAVAGDEPQFATAGRFHVAVPAGKASVKIWSSSASGAPLVGEATGEGTVAIVAKRATPLRGQLLLWPKMQPLEGVELIAAGNEAITDRDGRFVIDGLNPGTVRIVSFDAVGRDRTWNRSTDEPAILAAAVPWLAMPFNFEVFEGKVTIAEEFGALTRQYPDLEKYDEILSVGQVPVANLDTGSLAGIFDTLPKDVPVIIKKGGGGAPGTIYRKR